MLLAELLTWLSVSGVHIFVLRCQLLGAPGKRPTWLAARISADRTNLADVASNWWRKQASHQVAQERSIQRDTAWVTFRCERHPILRRIGGTQPSAHQPGHFCSAILRSGTAGRRGPESPGGGADGSWENWWRPRKGRDHVYKPRAERGLPPR